MTSVIGFPNFPNLLVLLLNVLQMIWRLPQSSQFQLRFTCWRFSIFIVLAKVHVDDGDDLSSDREGSSQCCGEVRLVACLPLGSFLPSGMTALLEASHTSYVLRANAAGADPGAARQWHKEEKPQCGVCCRGNIVLRTCFSPLVSSTLDAAFLCCISATSHRASVCCVTLASYRHSSQTAASTSVGLFLTVGISDTHACGTHGGNLPCTAAVSHQFVFFSFCQFLIVNSC